MIQIHPHQVLYFNPLIGGFRGAAEKNFPGWGSDLGNAYIEGVRWVNENVEPGAKLALLLGLMTNVPSSKVRPDIKFSNIEKTFNDHGGEYILGLAYQPLPLPYGAQYALNYLLPVWEKRLEGVPIVRVWRNDLTRVKKGFMVEEAWEGRRMTFLPNGLMIDLGEPFFLTKLELGLTKAGQEQIRDGLILISLDGQSWRAEPERLLEEQIPQLKKQQEEKLTHLLAALPGRYLKIEMTPFKKEYLKLDGLNPKVWVLKEVRPLLD